MALDSQLMERVFSSPQLPSLPAIALKIIGLVQEDEVNIDQIAETISLDPALSSKILKTVNSSFYGLPKTVGSVHQAVVVLGLNSVKTLALGFSLVQNLTGAGSAGFDHMSFWRRSLYSATAAKQLCEKLNVVQAEEVFIASLMQDVGKLALAQVLGKPYADLAKATERDHRLLSGMEREAYDCDHTEVGGALAESWCLPPLLVESIRLHERPDEAPDNLKGLIRIVHVGALAADLIDNPDDAEHVSAFHTRLKEWFEIDQAAGELLLRDVFGRAREAQRLFELPTGELADPEKILSQAREVMRKLSADVRQEVGLVGQAEPEPAPEPAAAPEPAPAPGAASEAIAATEASRPAADESKGKRDALTGLGSRRAFDEKLDEQFLAAGVGSPLSLLFIDLDEFKHVNEACGKDMGDTVLCAVAELIRSACEGVGVAYRFHEDEFTVLCPGVERSQAALLAEGLRSQIERSRFEVGSGKIQAMTASLGVATYEGTLFKRPEQLVKASSKGVLAAKDGGRNVVRVFVPRDPGQTRAA